MVGISNVETEDHFLTLIRGPRLLGALDPTIRDVWIFGPAPGHRYGIERSVFIHRSGRGDANTAIKGKYHVYMADNSRISIAGLNEGNVEYVARSITDCLLRIESPGHSS